MRPHHATTFSRRHFVAASGTFGIVGALCDGLNAVEKGSQNQQENRDNNGDKISFPAPEPIVLAAQRTVLLVIDMQRYFVHPDQTFGKAVDKDSPGSLAYYFDRVKNLVVPNCQRIQHAFRAARSNIVYTAFGSLREDGLDMPRWARGHNAWCYDLVGKPVYPSSKDPSWQIDDSLAPASDELVVAKTSSGPLNSTMLDQMLRTLGIDTLVVAGVVTDGCVTQAAREFADRDFKVLVVDDACATKKRSRHEAALETFADFYGEVATTDRVLAMLAEANRSK